MPMVVMAFSGAGSDDPEIPPGAFEPLPFGHGPPASMTSGCGLRAAGGNPVDTKLRASGTIGRHLAETGQVVGKTVSTMG